MLDVGLGSVYPCEGEDGPREVSGVVEAGRLGLGMWKGILKIGIDMTFPFIHWAGDRNGGSGLK